MEADIALAQRVATCLLNLSVATTVGASAATVWLRSASSPWALDLLPRLRKTMLACLVVAVAAYVAVLWFEAAAMAELPPFEAFPAVWSALTATHYGTAWMIGAAALVVVGMTAVLPTGVRRGGAGAAFRLAALGVFLYSRSIVSHAGAAGDLTWAVAVDWTHLVLISLWVGEVIVAGLITLRGPPHGLPFQPIAPIVRDTSRRSRVRRPWRWSAYSSLVC